VLLLGLLLLAAKFWEATPPAQWSEAELRQMFVESPWADAGAYLATARPMRIAEAELRRRTGAKSDLLYEDYLAWLEENGAKHVVLAVKLPKPELLADAAEARRVEKEALLSVGRTRVRAVLHFAPSSADPWVRLVFPRPQLGAAKEMTFELYVPGSAAAYTQAVFAVKDLMWKGTPEY
jgi:hypothetical protein